MPYEPFQLYDQLYDVFHRPKYSLIIYWLVLKASGYSAGHK